MFVDVKDPLLSRKKQGVHRELQLPLIADLARLFIPLFTQICSIREWDWRGQKVMDYDSGQRIKGASEGRRSHQGFIYFILSGRKLPRYRLQRL